jgi:transketolase
MESGLLLIKNIRAGKWRETMQTAELQQRAINTIRFLSADAVQKAKSGHPGLPMGAAAMAFALWTRHLRFNPKNPKWPDRDRFLLSGGHGSMLLYSLLFLTGYDLPLEELKNFRQFGSKTPGHPESFITPGVEVTTGPLGQGFANGVGLAIAEAHLAAEFNRTGHEIVNHYTYSIVTDGDLMEGVSSEAASLAGHLKLGKLIYLYDDNQVTIDGSTNLAFTEDVAARFSAYQWHIQTVPDGNDVDAVDEAIRNAKNDPRPSIIICSTRIGYGLPNKEGTADAHGEPPGDEELDGAKRRLGWPVEPRFYLPEDVLDFFRSSIDRGQELEKKWRDALDAYREDNPELAREFERRMAFELPEGWDSDVPVFPPDEKGLATRVSSGKVINALAKRVPELVGGSADLTPSTKTFIEGIASFQSESPEGRSLHYGVREHGMGSAINGMALHGGIIPFGATFLVFSDYMRPAIRLSALSHIPSIWVFTHDSIGLGEDGPTHQPVEHYAALRAIPNLIVIRPGDANEVAEAWRVALTTQGGPTALLLTRQNVPTLDRQRFAGAEGLHKGAYILADLGEGEPQLILMASGSEVSLIVKAGERLAQAGAEVRLVSFPSWELFKRQEQEYRASVLPVNIPARLAVEAGVAQGWERWVGEQGQILSLEHFGVSAPGTTAMEKLGFNVDNVIDKARSMLESQ